MGMSTHVIGFRPADEKWNAMKTIWESCEKAGVEIPREVQNFFDDEPPRDKPGMEVPIREAAKQWSDEYRSGFELDVALLPEGVRYVRFYNSW